jgi:hypothetical protein
LKRRVCYRDIASPAEREYFVSVLRLTGGGEGFVPVLRLTDCRESFVSGHRFSDAEEDAAFDCCFEGARLQPRREHPKTCAALAAGL